MTRRALPNRRPAETFEFTVAGLRYTCTVGRFPDGSVAELFISNHKSNSAADTNARDLAIVFSIAVQCGADPGVIRRALSRNSQGRASSPLGTALDHLTRSLTPELGRKRETSARQPHPAATTSDERLKHEHPIDHH
jgi:hypothetical protein